MLSAVRLVSKETLWRTARKSLVYGGPCWVKLGQWAATRSDLFSQELCDVFSTLHSYVYSHSWGSTDTLLRTQLGHDYPSWLQLDRNPANTGAVGQVYRGSLSRGKDQESSSVRVAVKVLHPNIREDVTLNLYLLEMGARFLELFPAMRWLAPVQALENFSGTMLQQLDLTMEHRNLEKFRENFRHEAGVIFPLPYFSTPDILVESFEESLPISHAIRTGSSEAKRLLARRGIRMFLKMVFEDNFIHGDLHPGNMLVSRDHGDKVVVLDVGMTTSLHEEQQKIFYPLFKSFVTQDYTDVCRRLLKDAPVNDCSDPDHFVSEMSALVRSVAESRIKLGELDVSSLIVRFFRLLQKHHVQLESRFVSTIVSVLVLEGVGRSLDPDLDILAEATPFLR